MIDCFKFMQRNHGDLACYLRFRENYVAPAKWGVDMECGVGYKNSPFYSTDSDGAVVNEEGTPKYEPTSTRIIVHRYLPKPKMKILPLPPTEIMKNEGLEVIEIPYKKKKKDLPVVVLNPEKTPPVVWPNFSNWLLVENFDIKKFRTETLVLSGSSGKKCFTQAEFGQILGVSQDQISRWESNPESVKLTTLLEICDKFGFTPNEVLGIEEGLSPYIGGY